MSLCAHPPPTQHATLLSEVLWELPYMWGSTFEPGSTSDSCLRQLRANSHAPPLQPRSFLHSAYKLATTPRLT